MVALVGCGLRNSTIVQLHLYVGIGCHRIIRTLHFDVLKEGKNNFRFHLYLAAWSTK